MKIRLRPVLQEPYVRGILLKDAQKKGEDCHSSVLILVSIGCVSFVFSRILTEEQAISFMSQLLSEFLKEHVRQANTCIHGFSRQSENPPASQLFLVRP